MLAARYYGTGDIRLEEVPLPEIGPGEVLVRSCAAAICGTDLRIFQHGHSRIESGEVRILGHEMAGEIARVGSNVRRLRQGMNVAVAPNFGCGSCPHCLRADYHLCADYHAVGLTVDGGFAEFVRIPEKAVAQGALLVTGPGLPFEQAALNEPLACVCNGHERCPVHPGDGVLVIGAGPIGMINMMLARAEGASSVFAADLAAERVQQAVRFCADDGSTASGEELCAWLLDHTEGRGADVVITACPSGEVQKLALELAAVHGRVNFFGGLPSGREEVLLNSNLVHYKELTITGSHGCNTRHNIEALRLQTSGRVDLSPLVTHTFPLDKIEEAFQAAGSGMGLKIVVLPQKSEPEFSSP